MLKPVFRAALAAWIGGALRVGDWLYERREQIHAKMKQLGLARHAQIPAGRMTHQSSGSARAASHKAKRVGWTLGDKLSGLTAPMSRTMEMKPLAGLQTKKATRHLQFVRNENNPKGNPVSKR